MSSFRLEGEAYMQRMLEDRNVDAIIVATSNYWHSMELNQTCLPSGGLDSIKKAFGLFPR